MDQDAFDSNERTKNKRFPKNKIRGYENTVLPSIDCGITPGARSTIATATLASSRSFHRSALLGHQTHQGSRNQWKMPHAWGSPGGFHHAPSGIP
jgi:hypothetical protein